MVHFLAMFVKSIFNDVTWMEDPHSPALVALFFDVNASLCEW